MIKRTCTAEIPVIKLTTLITWLVLLDNSTQLLHTSHQDINCHRHKQLSLLTGTITEVT